MGLCTYDAGDIRDVTHPSRSPLPASKSGLHGEEKEQIEDRISNIEYRISNIEHRMSNVECRTSNRKSHTSLNQNELLYATEFRTIDMRFIRRNDFRFPICGAEVGSLDRGIAWHRSIPTPHHKSLALRSFAGMSPPDRGSNKSNIEYRKSHKSLNQNELLYTRVPDD